MWYLEWLKHVNGLVIDNGRNYFDFMNFKLFYASKYWEVTARKCDYSYKNLSLLSFSNTALLQSPLDFQVYINFIRPHTHIVIVWYFKLEVQNQCILFAPSKTDLYEMFEISSLTSF